MNIKLQLGLVIFLFFFVSGIASAEQVRQATLANFAGDVMIRQDGGEWKQATPGIIMKINDEIKTSSGASAELLLDNGKVGSVKIHEKSQFKIDTMDVDPTTGDKVTYLNLALGRILIQTQKLQGDSKFEVRTPTSTTGVRGTVFEVSTE